MEIPTEDDWRSEPWGIDTPRAYAHFYGTSFDKAVSLFEENAFYYQEDVMFMPSRVFPFYVRAYSAYLMSEAARGDSDGASCFITLLQHKSEHYRYDLVPIWPEVEPVLRRLAENQDFFDAEWNPYRSFRSRIHEIVQRGFRASFDTSSPEVVPPSATLAEMGYLPESMPWPVAVQVFRNSGITGLDETSGKGDVLHALGLPERSGGGPHATIGNIPDWVLYKLPEFYLNFQFEGDRIVTVTIMPRRGPFAEELC